RNAIPAQPKQTIRCITLLMAVSSSWRPRRRETRSEERPRSSRSGGMLSPVIARTGCTGPVTTYPVRVLIVPISTGVATLSRTSPTCSKGRDPSSAALINKTPEIHDLCQQILSVASALLGGIGGWCLLRCRARKTAPATALLHKLCHVLV